MYIVFYFEYYFNPPPFFDFFLRLFLRMQNGSYGMSGDLKPSFLPSLLQSIRCKRKAVDRWLADLHVTPLSV